jgi:hypothetical protein
VSPAGKFGRTLHERGPAAAQAAELTQPGVVHGLRHGRPRQRSSAEVDDFTKEAVMIEPEHSLTGDDVTELLDRVAQFRGYPQSRTHRPGTGGYVPEFRSMGLQTRCAAVADPTG